MSLDKPSNSPTTTHVSAAKVVEELVGLTRDFQELLESYAPTWYTEDFDTRVRETLAIYGEPSPGRMQREISSASSDPGSQGIRKGSA